MPELTLRQQYEQARTTHQTAHRRVCAADGIGLPEHEIARLEHDLEDALQERKRAFQAFMDSDET